jgi:hypothetical protein
MRNYIPAQIYLYDYKRLFVRVAVAAAIAVIAYPIFFGSI